ncbi:MAG: hypothetical protein AMJ59_01450 [Gammaproteobacteria bacterium SG8_31]|nr:MAG: hypothetical protein AMJ59_01450 [Gammaproteobacteria bacterium SG8_31]
MLIKFYSKVGSFTMFGDIATRLIKMMGHSGTVPGAIRADGLASAREKLHAAVAAAGSEPAEEPTDGDEDEKPPVTLHQRAYPLLELLERAEKEDCDVLWDKA